MSTKTKNLVLAALFAAIIAVFTAFIKINIGTNSGYMHFGDSMIYLAACFLPPPFAVGAAAVGGAFADLMAGAPLWAPATAIIKALNVLPFFLTYTIHKPENKNKILNKTTALLPIFSGLITVFGYFLASVIMYDMNAAVVSLPFNIVQAVGSAVVFYGAGYALDSVNFKKRFATQK